MTFYITDFTEYSNMKEVRIDFTISNWLTSVQWIVIQRKTEYGKHVLESSNCFRSESKDWI